MSDALIRVRDLDQAFKPAFGFTVEGFRRKRGAFLQILGLPATTRRAGRVEDRDVAVRSLVALETVISAAALACASAALSASGFTRRPRYPPD